MTLADVPKSHYFDSLIYARKLREDKRKRDAERKAYVKKKVNKALATHAYQQSRKRYRSQGRPRTRGGGKITITLDQLVKLVNK